MIELLITMLAMSLCGLLFTQIAHLLYTMNVTDFQLEDTIAIKQIQLMLAQATDYRIENQQLYFKYHGDEVRLEQYDHQLVKRKGYEVLLQEIDAIVFFRDHTCILMTYQRNEDIEEVTLACE